MTEWYVWDGRSKSGPMDRGELDSRIKAHPTPKVIRVWRQGLAEWTTVEEALAGAGEPQAALSGSAAAPAMPPSPAKHRNFIARNWRGEYSLGVTFWAIGLASTVAMLAMPLILGEFASWIESPLGTLAVLVLLWTFGVMLSVWYVVGVWRSASRRIAERAALGSKARWALVAKAAVILAGLQFAAQFVKTAVPHITEAGRVALLDDPNIPSYTIRVMNNGTEVGITGGIKFGLANDLEKVLDASTSVRLIHLDSDGGRAVEGRRLNALIRKRGLDTYVETTCSSACTLAFVAGRERILRREAKLGFHGASFAGGGPIDTGIERPLYVEAGLSRAFIDRALATKPADLWMPTEAELLDASVVTRVSDGDEYAVGDASIVPTRAEMDPHLQANSPMLRALKEKYPGMYDEVLNEYIQGLTMGTPRNQVESAVYAKVLALVNKLLPYAEDAVVLDYGRLSIDLFRSIQLRDQAACYKYVSGQNNEKIGGMIPEALVERKVALSARVIASAKRENVPLDNKRSLERLRARRAARGFTDKDAQLFKASSVRPEDYGRYCELTIAFYRDVVNLPSNEAVSLLREMFAEAHATTEREFPSR